MKQWNSTLKPGKGFRAKLPERKPAKQIGGAYKLGRPRETACRIEGLEARCREKLASFKTPRAFILVEKLPRTALGKIQKHLLPPFCG